MKQLCGVAFDIWLAGQETTSVSLSNTLFHILIFMLQNTLTSGIAYMIANPRVQKKIHEELDRIVGSDRIITVADRQQTHYLNAVIMVCLYFIVVFI